MSAVRSSLRSLVFLVLAAQAVSGQATDGMEPPRFRATGSATDAAASQAAWAKHLGREVVTIQQLGIKMVLIPPGEFLMGTSAEEVAQLIPWADSVRQLPPGAERTRITTEEQPQHRVELSRPFLLGATEVTVEQFTAFVTATGYQTDAERLGGGNSAIRNETNPQKRGVFWRNPGYETSPDRPVTQMTWNDAVAFCVWLSQQEKLPPAYETLPAESGSPENGWRLRPQASGYRLPTEAEWEYACRAGTTTPFSFGDDVAQLPRYAWYSGSVERGPSQKWGAKPVATLLSNPFGLWDMHGNAWEWTQDWHDPVWYARSPVRDPAGPETGSRRVVRGAGWHYFDLHCRSAYRNNYSPLARTGNTGFRLARTLGVRESQP